MPCIGHLAPIHPDLLTQRLHDLIATLRNLTLQAAVNGNQWAGCFPFFPSLGQQAPTLSVIVFVTASLYVLTYRNTWHRAGVTENPVGNELEGHPWRTNQCHQEKDFHEVIQALASQRHQTMPGPGGTRLVSFKAEKVRVEN